MIRGKLGTGTTTQKGTDLESGMSSAAAITCDLCGSSFYLMNGEVAEWTDGQKTPNLFGKLVGTLISKSPPARTKAYPTRTSTSGKVYIRL